MFVSACLGGVVAESGSYILGGLLSPSNGSLRQPTASGKKKGHMKPMPPGYILIPLRHDFAQLVLEMTTAQFNYYLPSSKHDYRAATSSLSQKKEALCGLCTQSKDKGG